MGICAVVRFDGTASAGRLGAASALTALIGIGCSAMGRSSARAAELVRFPAPAGAWGHVCRGDVWWQLDNHAEFLPLLLAARPLVAMQLWVASGMMAGLSVAASAGGCGPNCLTALGRAGCSCIATRFHWVVTQEAHSRQVGGPAQILAALSWLWYSMHLGAIQHQ